MIHLERLPQFTDSKEVPRPAEHVEPPQGRLGPFLGGMCCFEDEIDDDIMANLVLTLSTVAMMILVATAGVMTSSVRNCPPIRDQRKYEGFQWTIIDRNWEQWVHMSI
jgi:hypothetical protein